jgi:hypothetical protein
MRGAIDTLAPLRGIFRDLFHCYPRGKGKGVRTGIGFWGCLRAKYARDPEGLSGLERDTYLLASSSGKELKDAEVM